MDPFSLSKVPEGLEDVGGEDSSTVVVGCREAVRRLVTGCAPTGYLQGRVCPQLVGLRGGARGVVRAALPSIGPVHVALPSCQRL